MNNMTVRERIDKAIKQIAETDVKLAMMIMACIEFTSDCRLDKKNNEHFVLTYGTIIAGMLNQL